MKRILTAALAAALFLPAGALASQQTITPASAAVSVSAGTAHFTGRVRTEALFGAEGDFRAYGARVIFESGARTHWHVHPEGQVLLVTSGAGYTAAWGKELVALRAGDTVWCPPGVKHWHGAGPKTAMTHIAISQRGEPAVWLEPVSEAQYPKGERNEDHIS